MKLLFDQNLSPKLVVRLNDLFPGSLHVQSLQLDQAQDDVIWDYATHHGFTVVSKDEDYSVLSTMRGAPPKVIWLQMGNCTTDEIVEIFRDRTSEILAFDVNESLSILVLD
ncbi:DUF5615 family PIN-like protein [soil metagenome]